MWQHYYRPVNLEETLRLLADQQGHARIVAGGTDVVVELSRGIRPTETLIDITGLAELRAIHQDGETIRLGALATHNDVISSPLCVEQALPLAQACWEVGAPQLRTRATVAGNVITASPANDTITPLMALDAEVILVSLIGQRIVPLRKFYRGVRKTVLRPDELLREIRFRRLAPERGERGLFLKLGLRRAQAISVIDLAIVVAFDGEVVREVRITLGSLAPTIVHATTAETWLVGKRLTAEVCAEAGLLASRDAHPIDDLRGSAAYRLATLANLVRDGLQRLADGAERDDWPARPVLLETPSPDLAAPPFTGTIETTVNGVRQEWPNAIHKTLLNALRDDAGLTGTKEGCAEGECGACTIWLNGQAVMSCLVPAPQAHGGRITTIEGLAEAGELHPVQRAFIEHGAVQCGYCIPGMLMAGAKLLDERTESDWEAIQIALSGNICRCTGYRKILDAVAAAGEAR